MRRVFFASVTACAAALTAGTHAVATDSIVFVPARKLVRETVGCTLMDLGGIEKEQKLYRTWSSGSKLLTITGGETFVDGKASDTTAALALADGLKRLGVQIVAPAAADLALGAKQLPQLMARSGARWVATNVTGKSAPLESSHVERLGISTVHVYSLVDCTASLRRSGWRCTAPERALRSALRDGVGTTDLVVVVTTMTTKHLDALIRRFPRVNVWLDGTDRSSTGSLEARSTTAFVAAAPPYGQFAVRVELPSDSDRSGPYVDPLLVEDARRNPRVSRKLKAQIEAIPWATTRAVRFHIDPIQ